MKTTIIIPTYNERDNIEKLIKTIFNQNIVDLNIIVVDDNSPDKTADKVKELSKIYPVSLIERSKKLGIGSAYIAGFKRALAEGSELIFEMDADFSHDPDDINPMIEAAKNSDLVIGSRKISGGKIIGWGIIRKTMSNGAMFASRVLLNLKTKDVTAGFRCYRREVLERINLDNVKSNGYAFQEELLYRTEQNNFKVKEIPVTFVDRREGKSKLSKKDIIEFFITIIRLKFFSKKTILLQ